MDGKCDDRQCKQLRERGDSEKITINLGYVDLGRIDLLVQEGFYSNVTPELALATIASLTVLGALQASPEVRAALAGRVR
jgi:Ribbon-Helix-Helix transcriptional regulator family